MVERKRGRFYYVNVYLEDRAFGGSEEGGWYYDCGSPVRSFPFFTERKAARCLERVKRMVDSWNVGRREVSSVLSEGRYAAWIEDAPAAAYPATRPHYE